MHELEGDHQIAEMLKQYPPKLLLGAALATAELPETLRVEIMLFLGKTEEEARRTRANVTRIENGQAIEQISREWQKLIQAYNSYHDTQNNTAIYDFNPSRYGTVNAQNRTREPGIHKPVIQETESGDFFVFQKSHLSDSMALLPVPGRAINQGRYEGGAWGEMFECRNVDPDFRQQTSYSSFKVLIPAIVQRSGDQLNIIRKGVLEFTDKNQNDK